MTISALSQHGVLVTRPVNVALGEGDSLSDEQFSQDGAAVCVCLTSLQHSMIFKIVFFSLNKPGLCFFEIKSYFTKVCI